MCFMSNSKSRLSNLTWTFEKLSKAETEADVSAEDQMSKSYKVYFGCENFFGIFSWLVGFVEGCCWLVLG